MDAPLDPCDLDDTDPDMDGGAYVGPSSPVPATSGHPVFGCDLELTATQHAEGVGHVAQCSCYVAALEASASIAARRPRKVA